MTLLRLATIAIWALVAAYMAPAVWALARGRSRTGDPARLVCFCYAAVTVLGTARFMIAPDDVELWGAVNGFSIATAGLTLATARSYGRGPVV